MGDGGRHFEAEVEDFLLALKAYVLGPFDHAGEVAAGLDVLPDAEVAGTFFDEGVLFETILVNNFDTRATYSLVLGLQMETS